mmetsp:Transcript_20462/g.28702  ORF Transcript_20462/g.28702 Transcript_20462/m.28702 type:complete len:207 (-) Transcript_20462:428-1048(-)
MTCNELLSPLVSYSFSAAAKRALIRASASPTYLLKISGPLTIVGSLPDSILPICLANRVLPQPGGPYKRIPLACFMLSFARAEGGNSLMTKARRKMSQNCLSKPPISSSSIFFGNSLNGLRYPWGPSSPTSFRELLFTMNTVCPINFPLVSRLTLDLDFSLMSLLLLLLFFINCFISSKPTTEISRTLQTNALFAQETRNVCPMVR